MVEKILVPLDGSENATRALAMAVELAQKYDAEIVLLSVVRFGFDELQIADKYFSELKAYYEGMLVTALKTVREAAPDLTVTTKVVEGYPVDEIVNVARDESVDLIVMGRRGQSHLRHTLLGSVSDGVLDHSSCTVVIVK